jgi:hypothetical protein
MFDYQRVARCQMTSIMHDNAVLLQHMQSFDMIEGPVGFLQWMFRFHVGLEGFAKFFICCRNWPLSNAEMFFKTAGVVPVCLPAARALQNCLIRSWSFVGNVATVSSYFDIIWAMGKTKNEQPSRKKTWLGGVGSQLFVATGQFACSACGAVGMPKNPGPQVWPMENADWWFCFQWFSMVFQCAPVFFGIKWCPWKTTSMWCWANLGCPSTHGASMSISRTEALSSDTGFCDRCGRRQDVDHSAEATGRFLHKMVICPLDKWSPRL